MSRNTEDAFLSLPAGIGSRCAGAWRAFVSDPPRSRTLAAEALAGEDGASAPGWAGLCLAYHQARCAEVEPAQATLARARAGLREDARGRALADVIAGYVEVARGEPERAVATIESAVAANARSGTAHALDRFLAGHALALAHGRQGRLELVLHHHYANLLLLEPFGAPSPLAVVLLNLSSTLTAIDDWDEALELARRAVEHCAGMRNDALRRRAEINVALALRFLGRVDEALALLGRLQAEPFSDPGSDFALHLNFAEALAHRGDVARAARQLERARGCAAPGGDAHERANLAWVAGLVAARAGEVARAVESLEQAKREVLALRKLHVPLLPRIVEVLASCYARAGDHARAFETFQQFHDSYEARLGYTTRARYTGRQSRLGLAAIAAALDGSSQGGPVEHARLDEALRRTLASGPAGGAALPGWSATSIARIGSEARGLGVGSQYVGDLVESLSRGPDASSLEAPTQGVRVEVLGAFAISVGGAALRFGRKRPERPLALLRYLAMHARREVAESQVADALWPDLEGDAALRALAVNLHRLRQLLGGPEAVIHHARSLALDMRHVWCDALVFEGLLDRAAAAGDEGERDRLARRAIALYRGDLQVDEDREPWAIGPRRRLHARFLGACAAEGARHAAAGRWEDACASFACGLALDPVAEELCLGFMRGCGALARPQEGIAAYRALESALAAHAREPAAALATLYRDLLASVR